MIDFILVPSCLSRQDASKHIQFFTYTTETSTKYLNSGQGYAVTQLSYCIWLDVLWWEKHNETTLMSLSLLNQKLLAKNGWWPRVTSDALLVVTNNNWHLGHHWWPKTTPFRVNGNVPMWKIGSWNFAHWLNMGRSRNSPDLRSRIWKI